MKESKPNQLPEAILQPALARVSNRLRSDVGTQDENEERSIQGILEGAESLLGVPSHLHLAGWADSGRRAVCPMVWGESCRLVGLVSRGRLSQANGPDQS